MLTILPSDTPSKSSEVIDKLWKNICLWVNYHSRIVNILSRAKLSINQHCLCPCLTHCYWTGLTYFHFKCDQPWCTDCGISHYSGVYSWSLRRGLYLQYKCNTSTLYLLLYFFYIFFHAACHISVSVYSNAVYQYNESPACSNIYSIYIIIFQPVCSKVPGCTTLKLVFLRLCWLPAAGEMLKMKKEETVGK